MTNQKKAILLIVMLAAVFVAAFLGYHALSGRVQDDGNIRQAAGDGAQTEQNMIRDESGSGAVQPVQQGTEDAVGTDGAGAGNALIPAPDFVLENSEGEQIWLSDYFGEPLVINFWASWCPPCKGEMPSFEAAWQKYGDQVTFLMVNLTDGSRETVETANAFIHENGYTFPVYYDTEGRGVSAYGVMSIPVTVCITADGEIYAQQIGAVQEEKLDEWIRIISDK